MKFTLGWIKEYCPCKLAPDKLAQQLTMRGIQVEEFYPIGNDIFFETEITANRADCLSVIGLAREIALLTKGKLKIPSIHLKESLSKTHQKNLERSDARGRIPRRNSLHPPF